MVQNTCEFATRHLSEFLEESLTHLSTLPSYMCERNQALSITSFTKSLQSNTVVAASFHGDIFCDRHLETDQDKKKDEHSKKRKMSSLTESFSQIAQSAKRNFQVKRCDKLGRRRLEGLIAT